MNCSIQLGLTSLNRTFHLSPHENSCAIAPITIYHLYRYLNDIASVIRLTCPNDNMHQLKHALYFPSLLLK